MNNEIRNESQALPESIRCVGADDLTLSLFENQYPVQPMGVSYNSYLILDEKIAVMDSVDARAADEWLAKLAQDVYKRQVYFHTHDREVLHKALTYFGVIGLFAVGAGLGALLTRVFAERGIWVSCALLAVSFLIMFIREEEAK